MEVEDVKRTKYTDLADLIETSYKYVSVTSKSITVSLNIGKGNFSAGGSYSKNYDDMLEIQRNTSTVTARTKYLDHRYTLLTNTRCPLNQKFIESIDDLLIAIELDIPELAAYLAESVIGDYGTHFVKRVKMFKFFLRIKLSSILLFQLQ